MFGLRVKEKQITFDNYSVTNMFQRLFSTWHAVHFHPFSRFSISFYISFYYIDTSVLLENIPLVKFIKTTSGTRVVYFP